jgi:hypothetical protein
VSANLDLVRSIYADWERGDYSSTEWAHPEIEFVMLGGPEPGSASGVSGMAEAWRSWLRAWEEFRAEAEEYRELDHQRALVLVQNTGRDKASGFEIGQMRTRGAALLDIVIAGWRDSSSTGTATAPSLTSAWRSRRCPTSPRRPTWLSLCAFSAKRSTTATSTR